MKENTINAELLTKMFLAGAASLEAKKEFINELNVFPVPDGDTGTNMTMTIMSAAKEVSMLDTLTMSTLAKAISSGSLRGARGNSGVILSQLLRGFTKELPEHKELDIQGLANACQRATATAYKAVMKPKEGTILTVAKGIADRAKELAETVTDLEEFLSGILQAGEETLAKTPDMLPVLKEAGVVDSGGQGLLEVLRGACDAYMGKETNYAVFETDSGATVVKPSEQEETEIKFGYCTEFIIVTEKELTKEDEKELKEFLESIGDSIVYVADEELVKIHVHTNDPGLAIQKGLSFGQLTRMKIDNLWEEHQEKLMKETQKRAEPQEQEKQERKNIGFIAVSIGEGLNEIFKELGADYIIEGGQTMNPSTEDILRAIEKVNAENIFILPNNSNIILAANQAKSLSKDKKIIVIPTTTVPQGITALVNYMQESSVEENEKMMKRGIDLVKTGQVTYAVRNTSIENKKIHEGDIMGIGDAGILSVGQSVVETTKEMLEKMADEDTELISLYYGKDVSETDAANLADDIGKLYPEADIDVHYGGQPIYYYVISVE